MASTKRQITKDGRVFYEIRCHVSRDKILKTRWYVPEGWSQKAIDRELTKQAADFERRCAAGEVLSRADIKEQKAAAEKAAAAILTVKQYGERVFMPSKAITCSEHTRAYYQSALDHHIYPAFGSVKIPELTSAQISAFMLELQKDGLAHSTIIGIYITLNLLLKMAYMNDMIDRNPMDKVERPKQRKDTARADSVESYTAEELRRIIDCLENEPLKWRAYMRLLIDTGIRRGEACGLQWKYVDFAENTITVAENLCYTKEKGIYLAKPKNGKARTIDVDPAVMAYLRELRAQQAAHGISAFVFTQDDSREPMHPQSPTRYMERFSRRYNVEHLHPHKLRHSFASVAITNGADIASVSEKLGHADKSTTLRLYTHADQESMKRASNIFREALKNA